MCKLPGLNA